MKRVASAGREFALQSPPAPASVRRMTNSLKIEPGRRGVDTGVARGAASPA